MIRTAYNIPDKNPGFISDCLLPFVCQPCVTNQLLQTVKEHGRVPYSGREFHRERFGLQDPDIGCSYCCYAFFCSQCAVATSLQQGVGVPCHLGLCCFNVCLARNVVRYHYRIHGDDVSEECLAPVCGYSCLAVLTVVLSFLTFGLCLPCMLGMGMAPLVKFLTTLLHETRTRGSGEHQRYIVGYSPPLAAGHEVQVQVTPHVPSTVVRADAAVVQPHLSGMSGYRNSSHGRIKSTDDSSSGGNEAAGVAHVNVIEAQPVAPAERREARSNSYSLSPDDCGIELPEAVVIGTNDGNQQWRSSKWS